MFLKELGTLRYRVDRLKNWYAVRGFPHFFRVQTPKVESNFEYEEAREEEMERENDRYDAYFASQL